MSETKWTTAELETMRGTARKMDAMRAAAPDLFEALKEMANVHSYASTLKLRRTAYVKAHAALSRARGG